MKTLKPSLNSNVFTIVIVTPREKKIPLKVKESFTKKELQSELKKQHEINASDFSFIYQDEVKICGPKCLKDYDISYDEFFNKDPMAKIVCCDVSGIENMIINVYVRNRSIHVCPQINKLKNILDLKKLFCSFLGVDKLNCGKNITCHLKKEIRDNRSSKFVKILQSDSKKIKDLKTDLQGLNVACLVLKSKEHPHIDKIVEGEKTRRVKVLENILKNIGKKCKIVKEDQRIIDQISELIKKPLGFVRVFYEASLEMNLDYYSSQFRGLTTKVVKLGDKIGSGSDGEVFDVKEIGGKKTNDFCVKKIFDIGFIQTKQLLKEFEIPIKIPHPNIIRVISHFKEFTSNLRPTKLEKQTGYGVTSCFLLKKYDYTLADYIKKVGKLKEEEILLILIQLFKIVDHLTKNKISHRDMKVDDIMFTENGQKIVLIDFGCSTFGLLSKTREGAICCKAPEILMAKKDALIDFSKNDVWSIGCLCYQMVGKGNPIDWFTGKIKKFPKKKYPLVWKVVSCCLQVNPTKRSSASELISFCERLFFLGKKEKVERKCEELYLDCVDQYKKKYNGTFKNYVDLLLCEFLLKNYGKLRSIRRNFSYISFLEEADEMGYDKLLTRKWLLKQHLEGKHCFEINRYVNEISDKKTYSLVVNPIPLDEIVKTLRPRCIITPKIKESLTLSCFEMIEKIGGLKASGDGHGVCSQVYLVRCVVNKEYYALKLMMNYYFSHAAQKMAWSTIQLKERFSKEIDLPKKR